MIAENLWLLGGGGVLFFGISSGLGFSWTIIFSVLLLLSLYRRKLIVLWKVLPRDLRSIFLLRKTYKLFGEYQKRDLTIIDLFRQRVDKHPNKPIFYFEDENWTFSDLESFSNRIGNVFLEAGYEKGDVVGLLMGNCPQYVGIWLGLSKVGVVTALVNTNLRNLSLVHSLRAAGVKGLVYSEEHESAVEEILAHAGPIKRYRWGGKSRGTDDEVRDLAILTKEASAKAPRARGGSVGYRDKVLYVFTSGTTGLPKAAIIPHHRLLMMYLALVHILGVKEDDVIYNPLPLYHTAGGLLGISAPLAHGCASVIKKKFSASSYWPDCIKYNCTVAQYIGEMCRYVFMVPPRLEDTQHRVRYIFGNGMKTSLWTEFEKRFRLERICEIYGSTEGNTNLVNIDKTVGAVGFLVRILPEAWIPMALIKVDEFGQPVRNSRGLCDRCAPNEPGMFIGMIVKADATREYSGYVGDGKESEKKVIENVFRKGDRAFLSGDLLVMDELGYLYFKDRTGDTYKWKGENVSTAEVEGIISSAVGLRDVLVYGVRVGNLEGRAGMATIVDPDSKVDVSSLGKELQRNLPSYARPLFLRFANRVDLTGTFKLKKLDFQNEGFDPRVVKDRLYFRKGNNEYVPLTEELYRDVISGRVRV